VKVPALLFISALWLAPAPARAQEPAPSGAQEKGEWRTAYGGPAEAVHAAALKPGDHRRLLARVEFFRWRAEPPRVDYEKQMMVGICLGRRPTGGYGVRFLSAGPEKEGGKEYLVVRYEEARPGGFATQALTAPCLLKVLPRPGGPERPVLFERTLRQWFRNDLERER